jgi:hypothetical protein
MTNSNHSPLKDELDRIAEQIMNVLAPLSHRESLQFLSNLLTAVAREQNETVGERIPNDPSDIGAPPDAPKPVPVPPEIVAAAILDFNEAEIMEDVKEILGGGGYQLEDILSELDKAIEAV